MRTAKQPLMVEDIPTETKPIRCREEIQLMLDEAIERRDAWFNYWDKTKLSERKMLQP